MIMRGSSAELLHNVELPLVFSLLYNLPVFLSTFNPYRQSSTFLPIPTPIIYAFTIPPEVLFPKPQGLRREHFRRNA